MDLARSAVAIRTRSGALMYGVVTGPVGAAAPARAIVFCYAGLQCKSGAGDYFRWLGDELAARGYLVLRFDQPGTGDSPDAGGGEMPLNDYFRKVQGGLYQAATVDAVQWLRATWHPREVYLWGHCGGCISATLACALRPDDVQGLIMVVPPVLYLPASTQTAAVREHDAVIARQAYLKKLLSPQSYLRLLSGKSEYRLILASLQTTARQLRSRLGRRVAGLRGQAQPDHPLFNWPFWEALQRVLGARKPVLFLMAELDNETPEFDHELKEKVLVHRPDYLAQCTIQYLAKADHSLLFAEARLRSREMMLEWLAAR